MNNSKLINQDSGNFEYYTPIELVESARKVMGTIDLDPATSERANAIIGAKVGYVSDGLLQAWKGNVWMNHPFSRENNKLWIKKLVDSYYNGDVTQACCITYASTSEKWFQPLMDFPICFLSPRTNYLLPDGSVKKGATKGSCITYFGDSIFEFIREFQDKGIIMEQSNYLSYEIGG